ncbi:hypothetical protein [Halobellus rarus]|uniref:Uncharacterized protein n=1 Tax=Halobellus rarus TaxID=1126237 RepID=A0ABD6CQF0_9EURY|nr:hypothetical protein [Halobellus rarus]
MVAFFGALAIALAIGIGLAVGLGRQDYVAENIDEWVDSSRAAIEPVDSTSEDGPPGTE